MPRPVLIDTDTGVDDALALILALRSPELSVKAITTVAGNAKVSACTANVAYLLDLLQPADMPVVGQGASRPLARRLVTAPEVHGQDGLGNARRAHRFKVKRVDAVRLLLQVCRTYGRRLTIVALGPLTNVALALKRDPEALRRVGTIISMGGAFRVPGNTGPVAEFNYYVDPEAADLILRSSLPLRIVPLDITEQVVLMRNELVGRVNENPSALTKAIRRFTRFTMRYHRRTEGFDGMYLHDPVAVTAAIERDAIKWRRLHVGVETHGHLTRGMTVADFRIPDRLQRQRVWVGVGIDRERCLSLIHQRLWD